MIILWTLFVILTWLSAGSLIGVIDEYNVGNVKDANEYGWLFIGLTILDAVVAQIMWG